MNMNDFFQWQDQLFAQKEIEQAIAYSNPAQVYMLSDRLSEAKEAVEKTIALFTASSGDCDVHYAAAVNVLGEICYIRKETSQSPPSCSRRPWR